MALFVTFLFCTSLVACLASGNSPLMALAAGVPLFSAYALVKGCRVRDVGAMACKGLRSTAGILAIFALIGVVTGLWRACGTIPYIVSLSSAFLHPSLFLLAAFLLNCVASFVLGSAFATCATMGVVCFSASAAIGVDPAFAGGAIISGAYFGDRCSPVSGNANLVAQLTGTSAPANVLPMMRSCAVPFAVACIAYAAASLAGYAPSAAIGDLPDFGLIWSFGWPCLLPAVVVLSLAAFRVGTRIILAAGCLVAICVAVQVQGFDLPALACVCVFGFECDDPAANLLLHGGGLVSMARPAATVMLSSAIAGIVEGTGLLRPAQRHVERLAARTSPFAVELVASLGAAAIACNQTLAVILTEQLTKRVDVTASERAILLCNSATLVCGLVPWSIAATVPLASLGAPVSALPFSVFLWMVPLWSLAASRKASA